MLKLVSVVVVCGSVEMEVMWGGVRWVHHIIKDTVVCNTAV